MTIKQVVEQRWWWMVTVCVLAGTLLHMTGYNYGFSYIEEGDEGRLFTSAFAARRGEEFGIGVDLTGYPPMLMEVHRLVQPIAETVTGGPALRDMYVTIGFIRLILALLNGFTGALLAWTAYRISGRAAALLALGGWFLIPMVLRTTVIALTEGFQNFFFVLAFVLAVYTLERHSRWAAIAAVLAGIGAMLAKYSAIAAPGFGVGAVLWLMWQDNPRRWGRVLLIQAGIIVLAAIYFLPLVRALSSSSHPEAASFVAGENFSRYLDVAAHWRSETEAALMIGLAPLLFVGVLIAGSLLFGRRGWRGAAWGLLIVGVHAHLIVIAGYLLFAQILFRYIAPVLGLIILAVALALGEIGAWLARRSGKSWLQWGILVLLGLAWLLPQIPAMVAFVYDRTLPDTRGAMAEWSLNVLTTEYNLILSDTVSNGRVFARDYGGYRGLWQHSFVEDFGAQPVEVWREKYQYAIGTPAYFVDAFARQPELESQILLLKQFPPPDDTRAWRGNPLMFYRLRWMEHETRQRLGDAVVLAGYDLEQTADALVLTPYWQAEKLPERNYNVYLHLATPESRDIIAQADGIPTFNRLTRTWYDPGETLIGTTFTVPLPPDVSGEYRLLLGMYDYESGARLLSETGEDFVELARITIGE